MSDEHDHDWFPTRLCVSPFEDYDGWGYRLVYMQGCACGLLRVPPDSIEQYRREVRDDR